MASTNSEDELPSHLQHLRDEIDLSEGSLARRILKFVDEQEHEPKKQEIRAYFKDEKDEDDTEVKRRVAQLNYQNYLDRRPVYDSPLYVTDKGQKVIEVPGNIRFDGQPFDVLITLSVRWDPVTTNKIATKCTLDNQQVSSTLHSLWKKNLVDRYDEDTPYEYKMNEDGRKELRETINHEKERGRQ